MRPPTNEVRVALAEAKASQRCWLRQHASWRHLALRARRRWRGRCAPPTPAASLISVSRYALGARRTALRAEGAARLCAGRHSRWLPSPPRATRSAPMAWARCAPGRLRQPGRGLALRARRRWRGRRAPGRLHVPPPDHARVASWWWGCRGRRALRAARELCARRALRAPAEGEGGEGCFRHHHARVCGGTLACYRSMCSASRRGAPLQPERLNPQARPIPRTLSACSAQSPLMIGVMTIVMTIVRPLDKRQASRPFSS